MSTHWRKKIGLLVLLAGFAGLVGCSAATHGSSGSMGSTNTAPATAAYMLGPEAVSVVAYATTGNNSSSTIALPSSYYLLGAVSLRTDPSGQVYVPSWGTNLNAAQILVYPANATSSTSPARTVDVSPDLIGFAVDAKGLLYVVTGTQGSISPALTVYSAEGNGPATPMRTLQLANVLQVSDIAVDASQNIYIAAAINTETASWVPVIEVFAPDASGTDAPMRTITLAYGANGIAVDGAGNVYANLETGNYGGDYAVIVQEFGPSANGTATPINTITVMQQTSANDPAIAGGAVRIDGAGNIFTSMFINSENASLGNYVIYEFAPGANGNAVPIGQITVPAQNVYTDEFAVN